MEKSFTIVKVGYSVGVYGCSGEYFLATWTGEKGQESIHFQGMYGTEERVGQVLKDKGYKEIYTPSRFGQLKGRERRGFMGEFAAIEEIEKRA